jgi:hypothetical protein
MMDTGDANMRKIILALVAVSAAMPLTPASMADARTRHYRHTYYHTCHRHNGTTGALVGGGVGALAGAAVTHGAAGPIVGAAGGALLGRHIQRHNSRYRC